MHSHSRKNGKTKINFRSGLLSDESFLWDSTLMGQDRIGLSDNPTNQNPPSPEMDRRRGGHFLVCAPHTGFPNEIKTKFSPREKSVAARFGVSLSVLDTGRSLGGLSLKNKNKCSKSWCPRKKNTEKKYKSLWSWVVGSIWLATA